MPEEPKLSHEELIQRLSQCPEPRAGCWQHIKTQRIYMVTDKCLIESTCEPAVVYTDGNLRWCRPLAEFLEKFRRLE